MSGLVRRYLAVCERIVAALNDPSRQQRTIALLLLGFVLLWTTHSILVHAPHDAHSDIGEAVGWWRDSADRHHPPVGTWVVGGWFALLPRLHGLVYLLAAIIVGLTLLIAWVLFGDWLDGDKRVVATVMLSVLPFFSFLGGKPNANLVMMPFWAAATLFFLRSFVRRDALSSALTGLSLAGAMLTKFWSVYLAAGMALAALLDRRRLQYLASAAPWIAAGLAVALLLPYALSLSSESEVLWFAGDTMTEQSRGEALLKSLRYLLDAAAYAAPALVIFAVLRPSRQAIGDVAIPSSQDGRLIASLLWLPLLLPALANVAYPHRLTALWTFPNWTLLPVVLLGTPLILVSRQAAVHALAFAMALPMVAVLIAPAIGAYIFLRPHRQGELHYQALAGSIDAAWRNSTSCPLRFIGGHKSLAKGATFYLETAAPKLVRDAQMIAGPLQPLPTEGIAMVCPVTERDCINMLGAFERQHGGRRSELTLVRRSFGIASPPESFVLLTVPPNKC